MNACNNPGHTQALSRNINIRNCDKVGVLNRKNVYSLSAARHN